tara:strand:+ start:381 stop:824 length:444 start_codon:yes stop_codon:yes gene_type:complete
VKKIYDTAVWAPLFAEFDPDPAMVAVLSGRIGACERAYPEFLDLLRVRVRGKVRVRVRGKVRGRSRDGRGLKALPVYDSCFSQVGGGSNIATVHCLLPVCCISESFIASRMHACALSLSHLNGKHSVCASSASSYQPVTTPYDLEER